MEIRSMESRHQEPQDIRLDVREERHARLLPESWVALAEPRSVRRESRAACVLQAPDDARSNAVHTAKYTPLTWLPKSLYMQFHRAANIYFVIVAVLACTPMWSGKALPKVITVASILFVQALKDLYEDLRRRQDDRDGNLRAFMLYDAEQRTFIRSTWQSCHVGDIMLVRKGEQFPADSLLLASAAGMNGVCYVATKSLDGETNLKQRQALPLLSPLISDRHSTEETCERILAVGIEIRLEQPHASLESMDCSVGLRDSSLVGASIDNFVLRACELQNTDWVICIACYVGNSTKVRLNASGSTSKRSELERYLNHCVSGIIFCIFTVSLMFAVLEAIFGYRRWKSAKVFTVYLITLYAVLPMTLYIIFELLHIVIGWQIEADRNMCDSDTGSYAKARNTSVLEDCGQASFVFSDKTGTLTANEMRFANGCIGNSVLGSCLPDPITGKQGPGFAEARKLLEAKHAPAQDFFEALAVCHTVKVDKDGSYQGESPDEVALVQAAADAHMRLSARNPDGAGESNMIVSPWGHKAYCVAHVLAFTSDRKRMSVICPGEEGCALVLTKGADSVMEGLLTGPVPEAAQTALQQFARSGLRTLIVAKRQMSASEYSAWRINWDQANAAMMNRAEQIERVCATAEVGMNYVGITALEDRLQDHVPQTISTLRRAGIRVWVLTGDKVETAVEIAKSCNLFEENMELTEVIGMSSADEAKNHLASVRNKLTATSVAHGLVLDGKSVQHIMGDQSAKQALYQVAEKSSACVCCRLSPLQKRELVELVRHASDSAITLAIGDGANDVPMIQGAHVGVGIRGKEGAASVQASDVAISQFRFLGNLLLCHGRKAYRRIATVVCYFMYKSVVLGWSYILFAHYSKFSGDFAFPELLDVTYNPLSSLAVFVLLASDCDCPDEVALQRVELYSLGHARAYLNWRVFAKWMGIASVHGIIAWVVPMRVLTSAEDWHNQRHGVKTTEFWAASFTAFTIIMLIIHGKLFIMAEKPMKTLGIFAIMLELVTYFGVACALGSPLLRIKELRDVTWTMVTSWQHVLCVILVPIAALSLDVILQLVQRHCMKCSPRRHTRLLD